MADHLFLRLEGPLQSWGLRARWDVRDSASEPAKSGVIGLLGCALGLARGDLELERLDDELTMAVRVERPGKPVVDFHTITGKLPRADGKFHGSPDDPATIISPRTYLQDAAFLVALGGTPALLKRCRDALSRPRWALYLGRRSCVPTRPVLDGISGDFGSLEQAIGSWPWSGHAARLYGENPPEHLRAFIEDPRGDLIRPDAIRVNTARMYGERRMRLLPDLPRPATEKEVTSCISPA